MTRLCRCLAAALAALGLTDAAAYCIYNGLRERTLSVVQDDHPEKSRHERRLNITLTPGQSHCCNFYNLDCNPSGREEGIVGFRIKLLEEPDIRCGLPGGKFQEDQVTVTGTGSLRVMPNTRKSQTVPYVVRSRTREGKDLSGPTGIACRKPSKE